MVSTFSRSLRAPATAALAFALVAALLAPATQGWGRWLVAAGTELPAGTRILEALPVADALLVSGPKTPAGAISADTGLSWKTLGTEGDPVPGTTLDSGVASTGAPAVWDVAESGRRAVVALIDTGVAPVAALSDSVAGEIDFSGTGGGDGHGHGTFMASVIAGRGGVAPGVAPGAGVLSLKVAGPDGSTSLGHVLAAMQWLHGPGRAAGIRVAALALGVDPGTEAALILERATDKLAEAGILVVTASGNEGSGTLTSPATAAKTFSVGAVDDRATADRSDDATATTPDGFAFSGTGPDRVGVTQPDVVASGVRVIGSVPVDSVIGLANADRLLDGGRLHGSGTSMATALTAGVAALASSTRPDLDGDALASALRAGGGELDAPATVAAALAAPQGRGSDHHFDKGNNGKANGKSNAGGNGNGKANGHDDLADPQAVKWAAVKWAAVKWAAVKWAGDHWGDADWGLAQWGAVKWAGRWVGGEWDGEDFGAVKWAAVKWAAVKWAAVKWAAVKWAADDWALLSSPDKG